MNCPQCILVALCCAAATIEWLDSEPWTCAAFFIFAVLVAMQ